VKLAVKPAGRWKRLRKLTGTWEERNKRVQEVFLRTFMDKFRELVVSQLPEDKWGRAYRDAIQEREVATSLRPGQHAYALIAVPKAVKLEDEPNETTAVYVVQERETITVLGTLLVQHGPWTIDRLPREAKGVEGVKYVHRKVTEDEVVRLRKRNDEILDEYRDNFKVAGATYDKDHQDDVEKPASIPDLLFTALRLEFGIKMKRLAHWGFAYRLKEQTMKGMVRDPQWEKYLRDPNFTKWVSPLPNLKKIPGQQVKVMIKAFQAKIAQ